MALVDVLGILKPEAIYRCLSRARAAEAQAVRRQPITPVHTFDVGRISAHIATLRLEHPGYGIGLPLTSEGSANE